jgi:hypothetical protein
VRWLVLIACAGCGRLAFEPRALASGDAAVDVGADASPFSCMTEAFEQGGVPAGLVTYGAGTVSVTGGQLRFGVPGTDQSEAGVTLLSSMSYVGHVTAIEVPSPSLVPGASTALGWHQVTVGRLSVHIEMDGTNLKFNSFDELSQEYTEYASVAYDAGEHRWWRLREEGGAVIGEVSGDGVSWLVLGKLPGYDTTDVRWDLGLGVYVGAITATESAVDNLADCVPAI